MKRLLVLVCLFRGDAPGDWRAETMTFEDGSRRVVPIQYCARCGRKTAWKRNGASNPAQRHGWQEWQE